MSRRRLLIERRAPIGPQIGSTGDCSSQVSRLRPRAHVIWAANSHFGGQSVSEAIIGQRALPREALRSDSSFYLTMAVISALIVFVGFAPSFYLKSVIHAPVPPLTLLTIVHGLVFTTWMVLFITQASLIRADNIALHRQLGILGAILFGVMLSLGYSTAITAGR